MVLVRRVFTRSAIWARKSLSLMCDRHLDGAVGGKIPVFAQGEIDSLTALFGGCKRRCDGVRRSLMLNSDFLESFVNGFGRGL